MAGRWDVDCRDLDRFWIPGCFYFKLFELKKILIQVKHHLLSTIFQVKHHLLSTILIQVTHHSIVLKAGLNALKPEKQA